VQRIDDVIRTAAGRLRQLAAFDPPQSAIAVNDVNFCQFGGAPMLGRMRKTRELKDRLFSEMMRRFGVTQRPDFGTAEGAMLHTAAARCIHCSKAARCKEWMEETAGAEGADEFCPNVAVFASLGRRARH
jgi:hypothetical protein